MVVEDAIEMYRSSVDWRKDFDVGSVMAEYGIGHAYDNASGMRLVEGNGQIGDFSRGVSVHKRHYLTRFVFMFFLG